VPPIYQPEVAARAIHYAAHHPGRREYYAAWSVVEAIVGNKMLPSFGDHFLARTGYDAQQHDGPEDANRPNNLWQPVSGDHGAHGSFDDRARDRSLELIAETNWKWITAAVLGTTAAVYGGIKFNSRTAANQHTQTPKFSKAA
jgi:hypothetical protein